MFHLTLQTGTRLLLLWHGFCQEAFLYGGEYQEVLICTESCGLFLHCHFDVACLKIWFGVIRHLTVFSFILGCLHMMEEYLVIVT